MNHYFFLGCVCRDFVTLLCTMGGVDKSIMLVKTVLKICVQKFGQRNQQLLKLISKLLSMPQKYLAFMSSTDRISEIVYNKNSFFLVLIWYMRNTFDDLP